MLTQLALEHVSSTLLKFIEETFSNVEGLYLDKGTTLYETLDGVTAEEASRSASPETATIAAQVEHVRFYLDVISEMVSELTIQHAYIEGGDFLIPPRPRVGKQDRHFVTALSRGLDVLSCFRSGSRLLGNQDISERCRLPKSDPL